MSIDAKILKKEPILYVPFDDVDPSGNPREVIGKSGGLARAIQVVGDAAYSVISSLIGDSIKLPPGSHVKIPTDPDIQIDEYTVSFWVKRYEGFTTAAILTIPIINDKYLEVFFDPYGELMIGLDGIVTETDIVFAPDESKYITVMGAGSTIEVYVSENIVYTETIDPTIVEGDILLGADKDENDQGEVEIAHFSIFPGLIDQEFIKDTSDVGITGFASRIFQEEDSILQLRTDGVRFLRSSWQTTGTITTK